MFAFFTIKINVLNVDMTRRFSGMVDDQKLVNKDFLKWRFSEYEEENLKKSCHVSRPVLSYYSVNSLNCE